VRIATRHGWRVGTNQRAARGRKCLHGLSGVTRGALRTELGPERAGNKDGDRRGDQAGESQGAREWLDPEGAR
jgi:hypothetical protein